MKKIVRLTESDLVRLVNRVIKEQSSDFAKFGCLSKLKDGVSAKGQKFKTDGTRQYYSNGRALDIKTKKMYDFECGDGDEILTTIA